MPFKKGQSGNPSGPKPGVHHSGRPPDWLKQQCRDIIDKRKLIEKLGRIADGEDMEQIVNDKGEIIRVPAPVREQQKAIELLLDRGYGKPSQDIQVGNTDGTGLNLIPPGAISALVDAIRQRTPNGSGSGDGKEAGK